MNLPELRVLDCSGTDIDEELFAKLLSFLPNLQQIALMGKFRFKDGVVEF